jgi:hypothetical protein
LDYCIGLRVVVEYYGRGMAADVPTTRLGRAGFSHMRLQASVISTGIDIGILLYRAMNVGLVLWLGMAHVVGLGFDVPTTRHDRAGV